jgi:hypothetical protein
MSWRLAVGTAAVLLVPFLTAPPAYVVSQYAACWEMLGIAAHVGVIVPWPHLFGALGVLGLDVSEHAQTSVRVVAALVVLALAIVARRRHGREQAAIEIFSLAATYLMLFNPRTENNTYLMIGPAVAVMAVQAWIDGERRSEACLLMAIAIAYSTTRTLTHAFPFQRSDIWLRPAITLIYTAYLVARITTARHSLVGRRLSDATFFSINLWSEPTKIAETATR